MPDVRRRRHSRVPEAQPARGAAGGSQPTRRRASGGLSRRRLETLPARAAREALPPRLTPVPSPRVPHSGRLPHHRGEATAPPPRLSAPLRGSGRVFHYLRVCRAPPPI